jgi:nucleoside-diphosphate-sugar epimerase
VVAIFATRARAGSDLRVDPGPRRDFTYVDDAAAGLCLALERAAPGFKVYNVGTGQPAGLDQLADAIVRQLSSPSRIVRPTTPWKGGDLVADITRARHELGYEPRIALPEGLRLLLDGPD